MDTYGYVGICGLCDGFVYSSSDDEDTHVCRPKDDYMDIDVCTICGGYDESAKMDDGQHCRDCAKL